MNKLAAIRLLVDLSNQRRIIRATNAEVIGRCCKALGLEEDEALELAQVMDAHGFLAFVKIGYRGL